MPGALIEVEGFPEVVKALASTATDMRKALRAGLSGLAEPLARDAEQFAVQGIPKVTLPWSRMRVGISHGFSLVYVAPRQRGVRGRGADHRRRPNFAELLRGRAMDPAVEKNSASLVANAEKLVDSVIGRRWA